jgi:hypothetical protein
MALDQSRTVYHKHYAAAGMFGRGRFKSFPVQRVEHLLMVLRYVLQNPDQARR